MTHTDQSFVEVATAAGTVRGRWDAESARFLGIPYAQAPIGPLRFAAPVPHAGWGGVRDALAFGPTPQRGALAEVTLIPEPSYPGEETLNLNVFTPRPRGEAAALPVLVYIHGGGYVSGSPASPWYNGAAFNRDGIVVVTVSYRLGFDGFGWIEDAPHNRGVLDWLLALEWVQQNIAAFGGDPARVTVSGQSAGGAAVMALLATPRAQGLFAQGYAISGPIADVALERAEEFGRAMATELGVEPTRAGFSSLSEEQILAVQGRLANVGAQPDADAHADPLAALAGMVALTKGLPLAPVVDGELIPHPIREAVQTGIGSDKPLLMGATDDEFSMMLASAGDSLEAVPPAVVLSALGLDDATCAAYLAAGEPGRRTADVVGRYITDAMFRGAQLQIAEMRGAAPTWLYRFSWRSPVFGSAMHCLDMPFIFDCLDLDRVSAVAGENPPQALADDVHGAAAHFVRDGDPGWPRFDETDGWTRVFDTPSTTVRHGYASVQPLLPTLVG